MATETTKTEWTRGTEALAKALEIRETTGKLELSWDNKQRAQYAQLLATQICDPYADKHKKQAAWSQLEQRVEAVRTEYSQQLLAKTMAAMREAE